MRNNLKAFTLVEMIVAMAVSAIIVSATYASYELIANQYKKNADITELHSSGRSIMQMIEREVRMAGFEYRDANGTITYGGVSTPLVIKDSGNKCCDEVDLIYDKVNEALDWKGRLVSSSVDRIKIRFWAEAHTSNKGDRFRLYKQKTILGRNNALLSNPIVVNREVMADYIEDLQFINITNVMSLYRGYNGDNIQIIDPTTKNTVGYINTGRSPALAFGPNGLLYRGYNGDNIQIIDPTTKNTVGYINTGRSPALAFGPNGLLYRGYNGDNIQIIDPTTKNTVGYINTPRTSTIAFGPNGLLYRGYDGGDNIQIIDPTTKNTVGYINTPRTSTIAFGPNGLLYRGYDGGDNIQIIDPTTKNTVGYINTGRVSAIAFGPDGLLYHGYTGGSDINIIDPKTQRTVGYIRTGRTAAIAFKNKRTGQESLVTINLTLRSKNQYGKDRQFKKKDYLDGNFKIEKSDKYLRDTFSSKVLVRNLML